MSKCCVRSAVVRVPKLSTRPIFALLCVLAVTPSSFADTILYDSNGFEPPTFTAGSSPAGQDDSNPWQAIGGAPDAFGVETSIVASGIQAIQANGGGLNDGSFAFPGIFHAEAPNERVHIQVDMRERYRP